MTKRNVLIQIKTTRWAIPRSLFEENVVPEEEDVECEDEEVLEPAEMLTEGRLITGSQRVELVYEEGELTGMEGSVTTIGFARADAGLVTMMRTGPVHTAMVFEEGKRHICLYNTPFSEFEICVHALHVENRLLTDGVLILDYLVEVHGAQAERCQMTITVRAEADIGVF